MTSLFDESRYDAFSAEQHRSKRTGVTVAEAQLERAKAYVERLREELASPDITPSDAQRKHDALKEWEPFLAELLADQATGRQEAAE